MSLLSEMSKPSTVMRLSLGFFLAFLLLPASGFSQTLSCGQTITASISTVGEKDTYTLQGVSQGDTITIRMMKTSGNLIFPFLELFDGSNTGIDFGFREITKRLDTAGPYKVVASNFGNDKTGDYRLFLQRVNNPCGATLFSCGQTIAASIGVVGEIDTYSLQGVGPGDILTLRMETPSGSPIGPYLELYDGAGTRLAEAFRQINKALSTAGPYTLLAYDFGNDATGDYRLSCSSQRDVSSPTVTVTAPNGGEIIETGSNFPIKWTSTDNVGVTSHEVRFSPNGGASFPTVVATGLAGNVQSFNWTVPAGLGTPSGRIRVIARDAAGNSGQADSGNFIIVDTAQLKATTYTYDKLNRLIKVEYADGTVITYAYDAAGNRTSMAVQAGGGGGTFGNWTPLPGGGLTPSAPEGVAFNGEPRVFVQGTDNRIYQNRLTAGGWTGWSEVPGGELTPSGPGAVVFNNELYLFVRGTNNRIYLNRLSGPTWTGWSEVPGGGSTPSGLAAVVFNSELYLLARGRNNRIYDNLLTAAGWSGWMEVPGGGSTPSGLAATVFSGELWAFVRGFNDRIYQNRLSGGSWTGWSEVAGGGSTPSRPAVAATTSTLYLVARGQNNGIYCVFSSKMHAYARAK